MYCFIQAWFTAAISVSPIATCRGMKSLVEFTDDESFMVSGFSVIFNVE